MVNNPSRASRSGVGYWWDVDGSLDLLFDENACKRLAKICMERAGFCGESNVWTFVEVPG